MELSFDVKNRKKLEPTSMARPAASASSIALDEVIPLLPSAAGQSLCCMTSTGLTSHQMFPVLIRELSTTWLWLGVGTKIFFVGGFGAFPSAAKVTDRSTEEACIVHVPGVGLFGSGHCVVMAELTFVFQASGTNPNALMSAAPRAGPQSSPGLPPSGQGIASFGF